MFKTYSSSSSLVITSRWFATSRLVAPVSVRLVYCIKLKTFFLVHRIFSCDQAALRTILSVCPSARLSVTPFSQCFLSSYHHEILRSYYHWQNRCPCNRSRSEVKSQGHRVQNKFCPNRPLVNSPDKRPMTRSFDVFFDHRGAGDFRRHLANYGVTVVICYIYGIFF